MTPSTVAIIGKPNVGKSTLFNRLIGYQKAIVDDEPGVTRDRQYSTCEWNGIVFNIIDTGGFLETSENQFQREINLQVSIALNEADFIFFVVDVESGVTPTDKLITELLRRKHKSVFVVVNKTDNHERLMAASEFYELGFDKMFMISSTSGSGTGDLLDALTEAITTQQTATFNNEVQQSTPQLPKFAIIGQPNVGKSSFLNALMEQERSIVSNISGTTRDSIYTTYNLYQKNFVLIDTAGIRKKKNMSEDIEYYSVIRAIKAIDESDVCFLLIDAEKKVTHQDLNLFQMMVKKGKGIVVLVNKWDLIAKDTNTAKDFEVEIKKRLEPLSDVPIIFISALEKTRIFKAIEMGLEVSQRLHQKFSTKNLNDELKEWTTKYQSPMYRGHHVKVKFIKQIPTKHISFALFCNYPEGVKDSYKNYLENQLRSTYPLTGVPIRLLLRKNDQ